MTKRKSEQATCDPCDLSPMPSKLPATALMSCMCTGEEPTMGKNYYDILAVPKNADEDQLKKVQASASPR